MIRHKYFWGLYIHHYRYNFRHHSIHSCNWCLHTYLWHSHYLNDHFRMVYKSELFTCETVITIALTFIRIGSIINKIFVAADSIVHTAKWIWTVFTAWITFTFKNAFKIITIQTVAFFKLWARIGLTRVHSEIRNKNRDTSDSSLSPDFITNIKCSYNIYAKI